MKIKLGINGFGRIGRNFFRASLKNKKFNEKIQVAAVNDVVDAKTLAHLLKYDSILGIIDAEIGHTADAIIVDGVEIKVLNVMDPASLPWKDLGATVVLESTGRFTSRESSEKHIKAGAQKVLISAPAKKPDVTLAPGINEKAYDPEKHNIISMASCTTNCLASMAKVLNDRFKVKRGFMTTCHAYTNDQRILDLAHRDLRRARACAVSIIPTTTGAASAIGLVIPDLAGKLDGIALRVPVANGSISDLTVELEQEVTKEEVNQAYKDAAEKELRGILEYTDDPIVSADIIGNPHSCIIDGLSTMTIGGKSNFVKVFGWYDNEWGYSNRLVDMINYITS